MWGFESQRDMQKEKQFKQCPAVWSYCAGQTFVQIHTVQSCARIVKFKVQRVIHRQLQWAVSWGEI